MLPYLIAIPLIAHGLAHLSGVFAPWVNSLQGFGSEPWLFGGAVTIGSGIGRGYSLVWLAAAGCLGLSGAMLLMRQGAWSTLAIVGAGLSLLAILPWWNAVPAGARVGAAFDLLILVTLLSPLKDKIAFF